MSTKGGGTIIPCSQNSDNNQPMDLAQKSHLARIAELSPVRHGTPTLVHIGGSIIPSNSGGHNAAKPCLTNESNIAYVRQPNQASGSQNVLTGAAVNLGAPTVGALKNISQAASLSITAPIASTPPSAHVGYHIPRGAAYVANIASRSQNVASIIRTTNQLTGSTLSVTGGRSNIGPRVMPMSTSGSNWISRTTPTGLAGKVQPSRGCVAAGRANQNYIPNVAAYSPAIKPTGLSTNKLQKGTLKTGIGDGLRMQTPKGLNIAHTGQKYISNIVAGSGRTISSVSSATHDSLFSPCSSLVTSLASSGTTITPHPIANRSQTSAIAVRITSAPTSASQVSIQSNSSFGAITLTAASVASPCGTILTHHPATITRAQNMEHHIPIKTPIVRSQHSAGIHHGKISASGIPSGAQITFPGSKLISQTGQGAGPVSLTHISTVTPKTTLNIPSASSVPFHSRSANTLGTIGRVAGTGLPMGKVVSHNPPSIIHPPTTSSPVTIVGANLPTTTHNSSDSHPGVLVQRSPHTSVTVTRSERIASTLPHYNISTPYYLESGQASFSVNTTIVPQSGTHYFPSAINSASLRIPSTSSCTSSSSESSHSASIPTLKVNSSPRPSILRKRPDFEGSPSKVSKNLSATLSLPITSPSSPKRPESRGTGNFSSTTASANSSPGIACEDDCNGGQLKIGLPEPSFSDDTAAAASCVLSLALSGRNFRTGLKNTPENGYQSRVPLNIPSPMDGVSPRKKPRKQQLMGNELQEARHEEKEFDQMPIMKKIKLESSSNLASAAEVDDEQSSEGAQIELREDTPTPDAAANQRPHMTLITSCRHALKTRNNHFLRHSDIRLKDEPKKTVVEVANQKMALQKAEGWKMVHLGGQFEDLTDLELEVVERLETMLSNLEKFHPKKCYKDFEKDVNNLSELYKANIQRSKSIQSQMTDGKTQMSKIFDHKSNIKEILNKYINKRVIRRKERP